MPRPGKAVEAHDPSAALSIGTGEATAGEALPRLEADDTALVAAFDAVIAASVVGAGEWVRCRIGCTECCIGPFDITALDAWRLRRGLVALAELDPGAAAALRQRARLQWELLREGFPGDGTSGRLADDDGAREAFFSRFARLPCPALSDDGRCLVYPFRPLSCRSFGLPVRCGGQLLAPCRLNFAGASAEVVAAAVVDPDPHDREGELLARLAEVSGWWGDTVVAAALATAGE